MFCKLIAFAACVAVVLGQADRYPAGLNPALCPNYPNCDNAALAQHSAAPVVPVAAAPSARQFPHGVNAAICPNYPYCENGGIPLPASYYPAAAVPTGRQWPAGVNPASCPNYPYCN